MIIFHEGMPRSGKSYAASVDHILPALKAGRRMYVRIDGINHDQFAELAGITPERCRELLTVLEEVDVPKLDQIDIAKDSLIVIDELQNYFPAGKQALSPGMTKWIAEHGHHGLDVLCMGQLLKDCHRTWINRTNRKIQFVKKDVLGKADAYKWRMFTGSPDARGSVRFVEVQKGDGKYDKRYFGCYKSHSEGTGNTGTYADDRANIFKSAMFRRWLPLYAVIALVGLAYIYHAFKGGGLEKSLQVKKPVPSFQTRPQTRPAAAPSPAPPTPAKAEAAPAKFADDFPDVVTDLSKANRIRLVSVVRSAAHTRILVEWRDVSLRVVDQMNDEDLEALGYHVLTTNNNRMALLSGPSGRYVATAWPIDDSIGRVPEERNDAIRRGSMPIRQPYPDEGPLPETAPVHTADALPLKLTAIRK